MEETWIFDRPDATTISSAIEFLPSSDNLTTSSALASLRAATTSFDNSLYVLGGLGILSAVLAVAFDADFDGALAGSVLILLT